MKTHCGPTARTRGLQKGGSALLTPLAIAACCLATAAACCFAAASGRIGARSTTLFLTSKGRLTCCGEIAVSAGHAWVKGKKEIPLLPTLCHVNGEHILILGICHGNEGCHSHLGEIAGQRARN